MVDKLDKLDKLNRTNDELREIKVALVCLCNLFTSYAQSVTGEYDEFQNIFNEYFEETHGKEAK